MNLLQKYYKGFYDYFKNRAFHINNEDFTYAQFLQNINGTRELMKYEVADNENPIGIICFDCIETYGAIFACWFSGFCFVPINPKHPIERNKVIIRNTGIKVVISASDDVNTIVDTEQVKLLNNSGVKSEKENVPAKVKGDQLLYILTTSGSTGIPKHVPINLDNVEAYCDGFLKLFPELYGNACFLQTYDLTSDAAFTGYLLPLLVGACVYTLPDDQFKFLTIARLMSDKKVDWVKLTPSVLSYLKPYRSKLDLTHIEHFIFGGEALPESLLNDWQYKIPNAEISNLYGPTETTISSTVYKFRSLDNVRTMNGIVSIGKPFPEVNFIVIDENRNVLEAGEKGELCIGGKQTMKGYLNENGNPFISILDEGEERKFYRTGDLIQMDNDGYSYFLGRIDDQVKISGYRVNLIEIENAVRDLISDYNIVALTQEKEQGIHRIIVFIEAFMGDCSEILDELKYRLPGYMLPDRIISVAAFPIATTGKTDRKKLLKDYL